ncbi:large ribosomal subunit protein uL1m isoform X2 [Ambystoma mexicanum]|uniref:large ribosomal subunit protein uL1m isoform X2 n=1 Tax=Ambystoma mexicanum TaxID=8296 RepID=UPI0037E8A99C
MVFQLVVSQCQKCAFPKIKQMMRVPFKQYVAPTAKFTKKASKDVKPVKGWLSKEEVELKRKDRSQPKPFGLTAWEPTDDVYVTKYYPWPTYDIEEAVQMLKKFQQLDFTYPKQPVYVDLKLDMNLDKKNASEITLALENGAAYAGGSELVQQILDDEIQADFYVAVPGVLSKLTPLKNKLRKQFPKSGRGSLGMDIPKMLELFKQGHEYTVENECVIKTKIASLDMPCEQIVDNLDALIKDICNHKPLHHGPFVERGLISSATSEALRFNLEQFLPQLGEEKTGSEVEL